MSKQIFRRTVPLNVLTDLLEEICLITDKYYLVDYNAYKKFLYDVDRKNSFLNSLIDYYQIAKRYYITREMTYNRFTTIIRHICRCNDRDFSTQMKYNESQYHIDYFVYLTTDGVNQNNS